MKVAPRKPAPIGHALQFVSPSAQTAKVQSERRRIFGVARRLFLERLSQCLRTALGLIAITSAAFGLGYGAGKLLHDPHAAALAHASGACIALEMAAAHGAIDEVQRRMALRALTSALNPHFGRFPERASEIATQCARLTKGTITGAVAR